MFEKKFIQKQVLIFFM